MATTLPSGRRASRTTTVPATAAAISAASVTSPKINRRLFVVVSTSARDCPAMTRVPSGFVDAATRKEP